MAVSTNTNRPPLRAVDIGTFNQPARYSLGIDGWYVFISPDGDFTLSFPEKPIREPDGQGPRTLTGPSWGLANEWNDGYEQELLRKDREDNHRVVRTQRIGRNTFEVEIWDAGNDTGESINYIRRTIVRRARIYTLLCGSEIYGRRVNKSICRRFFASMPISREQMTLHLQP
jgi:hypothetical protein